MAYDFCKYINYEYIKNTIDRLISGIPLILNTHMHLITNLDDIWIPTAIKESNKLSWSSKHAFVQLLCYKLQLSDELSIQTHLSKCLFIVLEETELERFAFGNCWQIGVPSGQLMLTSHTTTTSDSMIILKYTLMYT